jgi:hypothetical protein
MTAFQNSRFFPKEISAGLRFDLRVTIRVLFIQSLTCLALQPLEPNE